MTELDSDFFFNDTATTEIYTLSLHDALPISDVVDQQQVAVLPGVARGVGLVDLVDDLHDVLADRVAVAEPRVERQPVLAVHVHQVLAHLLGQRPLVEEGNLVEPAPLPGHGVADDGAAPLPGAQATIGLPLELDPVGPDRKSTRLNSSHANISYAVFCLKKKT